MKRYQEILNYCRNYYRKEHKFPTIYEVGYAFNITPQGASQQLKRIESKGFITRDGHKWRGYRFVVNDIHRRETEKRSIFGFLKRVIKGRG